MFEIDSDMTIHVTRGDVAFFTVTAESNGKRYKFQPNDVVRIKVYQKKNTSNVAFQKDFLIVEEKDMVDIYLTEVDTKIGDVISKPVDYWYEIELNPYTNPQTIIGYDDDGAKIFKLYPEGRDLSTIQREDIPYVDKELSLTSENPIQNQAVARALIEYEDRVALAEQRIEATATEAETLIADKADESWQRIEAVGNTTTHNIEQTASAAEQSIKDFADESQQRIETTGSTTESNINATATSAENRINEIAEAKKTEVDTHATTALGNAIAEIDAETDRALERVQEFETNAEASAERAESAASRAETLADLTIDSALNASSYNPIANKPVTEEFAKVREEFLPLTGGVVVKRAARSVFAVENTALNKATLAYWGQGVFMGEIGIDGAKGPIYRDANGNEKNLAGKDEIPDYVHDAPSLTAPILETAMTLKTGVYHYNLAGASYTGDDLPHINYGYSPATVFVRANGAARVVVLWGITHEAASAIQINRYASGDGKWSGWKEQSVEGHTHSKSEITDFPTSMPASDVYSWAKASSKPSYAWSEITNKPSTYTPASHTHTKSQITDFPTTMTPSAHNQSASTITQGTFAGKVVGNATAVATLGNAQFRNIYAGTDELTSGTSALASGNIYIQYE